MGKRDQQTGRRVSSRAAIVVAAFLACMATAICPAAGLAAGKSGGFPKLDPSPIQGIKLFDLGVADANGDGKLDLFTVNHKFDSSFLLGDGAGGPTESTTATGLNPTQQFPGFEALRRTPALSEPGLYIYATDRDEPRDPLHVDAVGLAASGHLTFGAQQLQVEQAVGAVVTVGQGPDGSATLDFEVDPGGSIDLSVEHIDLPIAVTIDQPTDPGQIRVGADAVAATSGQFELNLRDRHGYAFADYDSDGVTDLFIASGGLGGDINQPFFTPFARDELLLARAGRYLNETASSGLVKGDCRGRRADVADIDGDGDLDLLASCEESSPRVYAGDGAGHFTQVPGPAAPGEAHRLIDLIGDRRPELLVADGNQVGVWSSEAGAWTQRQRLTALNDTGSSIEHLGLGDLEGDGDLDVVASSPDGNTILRSRAGRLRRLDPKRLGIPANSDAGSFVDYDNDGDLDLHLMPQGLFESVDGVFERTGKIDYDRSGLAYAIDNWVDIDSDGRRDLLTARGRGEFAASQAVELRRNRIRGGHWLELDLVGPVGNAQAIGATAKVRSGDRWIHQWVGQNEDSRFSSGHYRLYFGLGEKRRMSKLVVSWPDGTKRRLGSTRGDRLLRLPYAGPVRSLRP